MSFRVRNVVFLTVSIALRVLGLGNNELLIMKRLVCIFERNSTDDSWKTRRGSSNSKIGVLGTNKEKLRNKLRFSTNQESLGRFTNHRNSPLVNYIVHFGLHSSF